MDDAKLFAAPRKRERRSEVLPQCEESITGRTASALRQQIRDPHAGQPRGSHVEVSYDARELREGDAGLIHVRALCLPRSALSAEAPTL